MKKRLMFFFLIFSLALTIIASAEYSVKHREQSFQSVEELLKVNPKAVPVVNEGLKKRAKFSAIPVKAMAVTCQNVDQMKSSILLNEGKHAFTLGYYTPNDGGSGYYLIREKKITDIDDGGSIIVLDNGNVAELITNGVVNVKQFGAKGDGVTDDSIAIQNAVKKQGTVIFGDARDTFLTTRVIRLKSNTKLDVNGATIHSKNAHLFYNFQTKDTFTKYDGNGNIGIINGKFIGSSFSFIHGENIRIENCDFSCCNGNHFFEICACKDVFFRNNTFSGTKAAGNKNKEYIQIDCCNYKSFPWLEKGSTTYDDTVTDNLVIENCTFENGNVEGYNQFNVAIGSHVSLNKDRAVANPNYHNTVIIRNCFFSNFSYRGIALWDVENAVIENSKFDNLHGTSDAYNILLYTCKNAVVNKNQFANAQNTCIYIGFCKNVTVNKNYYSYSTLNKPTKLITIYKCDTVTIKKNVNSATQKGASLSNSKNVLIEGNQIKERNGKYIDFIEEVIETTFLTRNKT